MSNVVTRAKFFVTKIERTQGSRVVKGADGKNVKDANGYDKRETCEMNTVHMAPVYGHSDPNHENTKFWESSPNGLLQLGCVNADAVSGFELGKEFYIDFVPAE